MCNSFQIDHKIAAHRVKNEGLTSLGDVCEFFCAEAGVGEMLIR
jgi:hypothetical protein